MQTEHRKPATTSHGINCNIQVMCDKFVQTGVPCKHNCAVQADLPTFTFEDIQDDPKKVKFYTGFPEKKSFLLIFDELSKNEEILREQVGKRTKLRYIDEFFLVMMRIRLGLLLQDIADRFRISSGTCSKVFGSWIRFLHVNLTPLIVWPSMASIQATMPMAFKFHFPNCRVIIDCTELFTRRPSSLVSQSLTYSHYKSNMTWKALIGITPNGCLSFVSDLWLGSISDQQIVLRSGLLDLVDKGEAIMADKGFDMARHTTEKGIALIIPPKKSKSRQMLAREIIETRRIASLRIHVERYMARVKKFRILGDVLSTVDYPNETWKVCNALTMLYKPLNPKK
jgi:hypothetical protein